MSPDPIHSSLSGSAERRQAAWPWLLLPLIVLALFFALRTVKQAPPHHATHAENPAESASSEAAGSR